MFRFLDGLLVLMDEAGDNQGGGGGDPAPKTFTQDQVNALLAKERRSLQSKIDEATQGSQATATQIAELQAKLEQIEQEKADAGKSAEEKARAAAERERLTYQKKIDEALNGKTAAEKAAAEAALALRETQLGYTLTGALTKLKLAPGALEDALDSFRRSSKIELDDAGAIVAVEVGEGRYAKLDEAAAAWLKTRPHFEAAPAGGSGARAPNGVPAGKKLSDLSIDELLALDASQRR